MNQKRTLTRPLPPIADPNEPTLGKALRGFFVFMLIAGVMGTLGWFYLSGLQREADEEDAGISYLTSIGQELWANGYSTRIEGDEQLSAALAEDMTRTRQLAEASYQKKDPGVKRTFGLNPDNQFNSGPKIAPTITVLPAGPAFRLTYTYRGREFFQLTLGLEVGAEKAHLVEYRPLKEVADMRSAAKLRREEVREDLKTPDPAASGEPAAAPGPGEAAPDTLPPGDPSPAPSDPAPASPASPSP